MLLATVYVPRFSLPELADVVNDGLAHVLPVTGAVGEGLGEGGVGCGEGEVGEAEGAGGDAEWPEGVGLLVGLTAFLVLTGCVGTRA
jgi:hypothetical protein